MTLAELRRAAPLTYRWRKGSQALTTNEWANLPESSRKGFTWRADPKLVEQLCAAERAETARIHEGLAS
jgi:hypothetical protein